MTYKKNTLPPGYYSWVELLHQIDAVNIRKLPEVEFDLPPVLSLSPADF